MTKRQEENFADRLFSLVHDEKENKQLKERAIAENIGISNGQLSKYLNDKAEIGIHNLEKIAEHFNCSFDYLLGKSNVKNIKNNIKVACATTGLSENAILLLSSMKKSQQTQFELDILSYLLEHGDIQKILAHLRVLMTSVFRQTLLGIDETSLYSESNEYDFSKAMVEIYRNICEDGLEHFFNQSKKMFELETPKNIAALSALKTHVDNTIQGLSSYKDLKITQEDYNATLLRIKLKEQAK